MTNHNDIIAANNRNTSIEQLSDTYYFFNYELEEKEAQRHLEWQMILAEREYKQDNTDFSDTEVGVNKDLDWCADLSFSELLEEWKLSNRYDRKEIHSVGAYAQQYVIEAELKARAEANAWLKLRLPLSLLTK